jgi:hypothetical protein
MPICPLCGTGISPLESFDIVEDQDGKRSSAHRRCTAGLPRDIDPALSGTTLEALGAESPESKTVTDDEGIVHDNPHYGNPYA